MTTLTDLRQEKDEYFAASPQSPLSEEQKPTFSGLNYYPENPSLNLQLDIHLFPEQETVQVQTTTDDIRDYTRYGQIQFEVEGQPQTLTVYETPHGFFIPFIDFNAGKETYPAGRYLDPELLPNGRLHVDFNLAYNPYCAYNDRYSCPLTPPENRLPVPILAGEKTFK